MPNTARDVRRKLVSRTNLSFSPENVMEKNFTPHGDVQPVIHVQRLQIRPVKQDWND